MALPFSRTGDAFIKKLADFSKGDADVLRKAMGKKQKMSLINPKFISQAAAKGHRKTSWKKYGKIGKPLLNMPLISRTLPAMHGLPIKQLIKSQLPC
jgi:hypothetical protein